MSSDPSNSSGNNSTANNSDHPPYLTDEQESALQAHLSLFPTIDDLPSGSNVQVVRLNNFSMEDHLRKAMLRANSSSRSANYPPFTNSSSVFASASTSRPRERGSGIPSGKERAARDALARKKLKANPFIPPADGKCPVDGLPNELLAYIFTLGAEAEAEGDEDDDGTEEEEEKFDWDDDEDEDEEEDEKPELEFQVLVSHVCRRWREIVIQVRYLSLLCSFFPS